jgi:uncharacterized protein YbcI
MANKYEQLKQLIRKITGNKVMALTKHTHVSEIKNLPPFNFLSDY